MNIQIKTSCNWAQLQSTVSACDGVINHRLEVFASGGTLREACEDFKEKLANLRSSLNESCNEEIDGMNAIIRQDEHQNQKAPNNNTGSGPR